MVDIEVDHGGALDAVLFLGVARGDRGVVEEAEPHRPRGFGVVAGRPRRNEGISRLAGHHLVDRMHDTADSPQGRLETARRHGRVGIQAHQTFLRRRLADGVDVVQGMAERDRVERCARRLDAGEHLEALVLERAVDGTQPIRAFGMAGWREVVEAGGVGDEERGHQPIRKRRGRET